MVGVRTLGVANEHSTALHRSWSGYWLRYAHNTALLIAR
jgi:hypothetical protein